MNVKEYIHESLEKLRTLGIDVMEQEEILAQSVLRMPEDILADMDEEQILGLLFDSVGGLGSYDEEKQCYLPMTDQIYSFDMEVFEISQMYTNFLQELSRILQGELVFTDVEEDDCKVDQESGTGIQTIRFRCNGTAYEYNAKAYYDWFDPRMLIFMNQVIRQQNTGKSLYITSDGYQNCIIFYQTEEWARKFQELLGIHLDQP